MLTSREKSPLQYQSKGHKTPVQQPIKPIGQWKAILCLLINKHGMPIKLIFSFKEMVRCSVYRHRYCMNSSSVRNKNVPTAFFKIHLFQVEFIHSKQGLLNSLIYHSLTVNEMCHCQLWIHQVTPMCSVQPLHIAAHLCNIFIDWWTRLLPPCVSLFVGWMLNVPATG